MTTRRAIVRDWGGRRSRSAARRWSPCCMQSTTRSSTASRGGRASTPSRPRSRSRRGRGIVVFPRLDRVCARACTRLRRFAIVNGGLHVAHISVDGAAASDYTGFASPRRRARGVGLVIPSATAAGGGGAAVGIPRVAVVAAALLYSLVCPSRRHRPDTSTATDRPPSAPTSLSRSSPPTPPARAGTSRRGTAPRSSSSTAAAATARARSTRRALAPRLRRARLRLAWPRGERGEPQCARLGLGEGRRGRPRSPR